MKDYISPEAVGVNFFPEAHVMLSVSNEVSSQPQLSNGRGAEDFNADWSVDE